MAKTGSLFSSVFIKKRDVKCATNGSDTDNTNSDGDPDTDFIEKSVRHLTVEIVKVNRVSNCESTVPIVIDDVSNG